ncbi:MAG: MFS transporter [Promethearchaeota archaeon]
MCFSILGVYYPLNNLIKFYIYVFLSNCRFYSTVWILFLLDRGLSWPEITTLDVVYWGVIILLSLPVGVIMDRFGRKKGLIAGDLFIAIGLTIFVFNPTVIGVFLAYIVWSSGFACINGPNQAFLYDYLKTENMVDRFPSAWRNAIIIANLAWAFASLIGGFLAKEDLGYPFFLAIPFLALGGIFAFSFEEKRPPKEETVSSFELLREAVSITRNTSKIQFLFILNAVVMCLTFIEVIFRAPYLEGFGFDEGDLGVIYLVLILLAAGGVYLSQLISQKISDHMSFLLISWFIALGLFSLSQASKYSALVIILFLAISRGVTRPLVANILNKWIPSRVRASMITLGSGISLIFLLFLEPLSGLIAETLSIREALMILSSINMVILFAFSILWIRSLKRSNTLESQKIIL